MAFWVTGAVAEKVGAASGLPVLAREPSRLTKPKLVEPGLVSISGHLKPDRELVTKWAEAGVTHLFVELPAAPNLDETMKMVSRYLAPEVLMPHFPRVMSESKVPLPWPGDGHKK